MAKARPAVSHADPKATLANAPVGLVVAQDVAASEALAPRENLRVLGEADAVELSQRDLSHLALPTCSPPT